jgi:D-sedoheptulose 7-phosphate isomerase
MKKEIIQQYFQVLGNCLANTETTDREGRPIPLAQAVNSAVGKIRAMTDKSNKVMFVGNGGSAGISSHMAIDYLKNGGVPAMAFNDGASLTCLANDLGYDQVFARQIAMHGRKGDLLIAISSSGKSASILNAATVAREAGCEICTLSGFKPDNPLRAMGDFNFYVPSQEYGFVEIAHLTICHAILDIKMDWLGG